MWRTAATASIRITLAVAGFSPDQLEVSVEDRQLTVLGRRDDNAAARPEDAFLHRGIAARGFIRSFVLADGMVVEEASLEHGLLHIDLSRPEPEKRMLQGSRSGPELKLEILSIKKETVGCPTSQPIERQAEPATVRSVAFYGGGHDDAYSID